MDRATKERGQCKKQRSDISQYRVHAEQARSIIRLYTAELSL
jgi:hypothetical protein